MSPSLILDRPRKDRRHFGPGSHEDGNPRCPYCLERVGDLEPSSGEGPPPACFVCRHSLIPVLTGTPPHRFTRPQQWDYLANEIEFFWNWECQILRGYQHCLGGYRSDDYTDAKESLERLFYVKTNTLRFRDEFLEGGGDMECMIVAGLENFSGGDGTFSRDLLSGRKWRRRVAVLSAEGAPPRPVGEFQLDYARSLSWGAFGSFESKVQVVESLERRLEGPDERHGQPPRHAP